MNPHPFIKWFADTTIEDIPIVGGKSCFASLFTDRAISYRTDKGFDHLKIALSVGVQHMVRADLACSGVMFTIDTETGFRDAVFVSASYGLGENVVQGSVTPDEYCISKPTLKTGFRPVLRNSLGSREARLIYQEDGGRTVGSAPVPPDERARFALTDDEALQLARWACVVKDHYSAKRGKPVPMDLEWAKDGITGELFIVQARPETVQSRNDLDIFGTYQLPRHAKILASGQGVATRIASGRVRVIRHPGMIGRFQAGEILVTDKTDPDWHPIMTKAAATVTRRGGRTCHAAIVSRELAVPAIVGVEKDADALVDGQMVTVSCAEGETGFVYEGVLPFRIKQTNVKDLTRPATKVMLNLANPEEPGYFIDRLAHGVATLASALYPKDVILRLSDFKTYEYANLIGGSAYEPIEENPMLGFRGASRYYHPHYQAGFALECRAVEEGINSISLNPDTVLKTTLAILQKKQSLATRALTPAGTTP